MSMYEERRSGPLTAAGRSFFLHFFVHLHPITTTFWFQRRKKEADFNRFTTDGRFGAIDGRRAYENTSL